MAAKPESEIDAGAGQSGAKRAHDSRRRLLLRGSLGAAPVVLSMASGPVIAGQAYTASAKASAPLSGTPRGQYTCNGRSPQSWCTKSGGNYVGWPCSTTTTYHGSNTYQVSGSQCGTKKHKDIMNSYCGLNGATLDTSKLNKLAAHCGASALNVQNGTIDNHVLDKARIQAIWDSCNTSGSWSPAAGVTWTVDDVCAWMATTWT